MSLSPVEILGLCVLAVGAGTIGFIFLQQIGQNLRLKSLHRMELAVFEERLNGMRDFRTRLQGLPVAWSGTRKFRVSEKKQEGGGICSFYLVPHDGRTPLPAFKPGQFLTFHINLNGKKHIRCYSLSDCYHADHYRISVKKNTPKDGHFSISTYFHEQIKEGDFVDVAAPSGDFVLDLHEGGAVVLSGSGVGVTPVLSMMNALVDARSRREIWFFYGVVDGSNHILRDKVREWRELGWPNLHIVVCFTKPTETDVKGVDYDENSRVDPALMRRLLPSNNFDFYTCGPVPMMKGLRDGLQEWGVPDERVHDEAFVQEAQAVSVSESKVSFRKSGVLLTISGSVTNLLNFATDNGVDTIIAGCKAGKQGCCQTALIEGKVKYLQRPEFNVEKGCCLPCICLPEGDIVLDA